MDVTTVAGDTNASHPKAGAAVEPTADDAARVFDFFLQTSRERPHSTPPPPVFAIGAQVPAAAAPPPEVPQPDEARHLPAAPASHNAAHAYSRVTEWGLYKDDQLLSNPGGDSYILDSNGPRGDAPVPSTIWGRLKKDVQDAYENVKNFFGHLLFGRTMHYRDGQGEIRTTKTRGVVESMVSAAKNIGKALSFGYYNPGESRGALSSFATGLKDAVLSDILQGVTGSTINMGEDLLLAGWNLVETVPDATIGNLRSGQELTTTVFDNGQVAIDYLTDILPGGEAWLRVHASDLTEMDTASLPILYNLQMPEQAEGDVRWEHVRNTPFRKTIETIGALLGDVMTTQLLGDIRLFSFEDEDEG